MSHPAFSPEKSEVRRCEECNTFDDWVDRVKFCPNHGKPVGSHPVPRCICGEAMSVYAEFCSQCGQPIPK